MLDFDARRGVSCWIIQRLPAGFDKLVHQLYQVLLQLGRCNFVFVSRVSQAACRLGSAWSSCHRRTPTSSSPNSWNS